jgi:hypothetical protein
MVLVGGSLRAEGPLVGDLTLLTTVADALEHNRAALKTWQGKAEIRFTWDGNADGLATRTRGLVTFSADMASGNVRWTYEGNDGVVANQPVAGYVSAGMARENKRYIVQPWPKDVPRPDAMPLVIKRDDWRRMLAGVEVMGNFDDRFRPEAYFLDAGAGGGEIARMLRWYKAHASDPKLIGGTVTEQGDLVVLEIASGQTVNRYEFSRSQACSLTRQLMKDANGETDVRVQYKKEGDVLIPAVLTSVQKRSPKDGGVEKVEVRFSEERVNQPTGDFSIEALGMKTGDEVVDRVSGRTYQVGQPAATLP